MPINACKVHSESVGLQNPNKGKNTIFLSFLFFLFDFLDRCLRMHIIRIYPKVYYKDKENMYDDLKYELHGTNWCN